MPRILYFCPENDMALAFGKENYTPTKAALQLRESGATLPMWIADKNDFVLMPEKYIAVANRLKQLYKLEGTPLSSLEGVRGDFAPWGWSAYTSSLYRKAGMNPEFLPSDSCIKAVRNLSHRRSSIAINRTIFSMIDGLVSTSPVEIFSADEALDIIELSSGLFIIKSPWSSSGRGIMVSNYNLKILSNFITGTIQHQGSIMLERYLDKTADFAMLFDIDDSNVKFNGLSLFCVEHGSAYSGNIITTQENLRSFIEQSVPSVDFDKLVSATVKALSDVVSFHSPGYHGPAGIDMMIVRDLDQRSSIAPCVELNLRCTMGVVAREVSKRIDLDRERIMSVSPRPTKSNTGVDMCGVADSPFLFNIR